MNYRHLYHAGNFADVCKHVILVNLINSFKYKDTPFCYFDTHAGRGRYHLLAVAAQQTQEYQGGINRLLNVGEILPGIASYLNLVIACNQGKSADIINYPGSPWIASALLRPQDRAILIELHPEELQILQQELGHHKQVAIHHLDGYQGIKALLPPKEKRGLLFIDPPFEKLEREFDDILTGIKIAHQRWRHGMIAVWYPIKARQVINHFHQQLTTQAIRKILVAELCLFPDDVKLRLNGSGMVIINPPWQFDRQVQTWLMQLLPWLTIADNPGKVSVKWLVTE
jgi:23S rRNA (adenine2030-N6)-methyltransferase